jgi:GT2 family glycosyltransferase
MQPFLCIIIVNWNGKSDTLECLMSLRTDTYTSKQIIVVDNGSEDDSVDAIQAAFPEVTVLQTGKNLGFTGGNNFGIDYALERAADYICLLNNDTTVEPDALTNLVDAMTVHGDYGLLTPVIHYFDSPDEIWFAGSSINLERGIAVHDNSRIPTRDDVPITIPWASGCAMLIRAQLLHQLAGFDERYFLNWEDVDLSLRIRALGSQIGLVPAARIYHKVGRSFAVSGTGLYYHVRNNLLLVSLHSGRTAGQAVRYVIRQKLVGALREIKNRPLQGGNSLKYTLRAINDHLHRKYGPLPKPVEP